MIKRGLSVGERVSNDEVGTHLNVTHTRLEEVSAGGEGRVLRPLS